MKILGIVCGVLEEIFTKTAQKSENDIQIRIIDKHLHTEPDKLRVELQKFLDNLTETFDFVVLGFGLCGGALNGLKSGKHTLVIPKSHDCITFYLGSKERYNEMVDKYENKCYWFTPSFFKQEYLPVKSFNDKKWQDYADKYDEDTADYLMEIELAPLKNYTHLMLVDDFSAPTEGMAGFAEQTANEYNWKIGVFDVVYDMFDMFFKGTYDENVFLTVLPENTVVQSQSAREIIAVKK